ncbi:helix-turn-helix transcriptional regulator [Bacillaceae bacterium Marseille-Q3522]|nr:helix-turn-helix transcriptional regulator [Bacillaceae bacterium Marseille-Q3522]
MPHIKLYVARREHRLKQTDVAKKLCISHQTYHRKECGKSEFTLTEAKMLAKIFKCSLDDLFGEQYERRQQNDCRGNVSIPNKA